MGRYFLIVSIYVFAALLSHASFAQNDYEVSCRGKAKELATETYRSCMTEQRAAQVEQIKKDYQEKLNNLKDQYEKEIEKLGGKSTSSGKKDKRVASSSKSKKSAKKVEIDMTGSKSNWTPEPQEQAMEIPEPIPVENVPSESSL